MNKYFEEEDEENIYPDAYLDEDDDEGEDEEDEEDEEKVCETCGGTGTVNTLEPVYPNEPHMAFTGNEPCPDCRQSFYEEDDGNDFDQDR